MLKAIKLDPLSILKGLETADTDLLPRHVLQELLKFIPTDEEVLSLKQYDNEVEQLAPAERFLFYVSNIHRYGEKVRAMYFKCGWGEMADDVSGLIGWLMDASKQVCQSAKFREMLKVNLLFFYFMRLFLRLGISKIVYIHLMGSMNSGQRGGAYGFTLLSILKVRRR